MKTGPKTNPTTIATVEKAPAHPADQQAVNRTIEILHKLGTHTLELRNRREHLRAELAMIDAQLRDNAEVFKKETGSLNGLLDMVANAPR